jgi:Domain of unknown function (DUF4365)
MKADSKSRIGRIGIAGTQLIFTRLGWIFREQPIEDYGIDAHVEVIEDEKATGRLIALQIKYGESWFAEKTINGFVFRGDVNHLRYWQKHSLTVLIVLYNHIEEVAYWQVVNSRNAQKTNKGWKLIIPFSQKIVDRISIDRINEFSKKLTAANGYTILSSKNVSHGILKRNSINILLNKEFTKLDIVEIVREVTNIWSEKNINVLFLFLYLSLDDRNCTNFICQAQWISNESSANPLIMKLEGEKIGDGIIINWQQNYEETAVMFNSHRIDKENYLSVALDILSKTKLIMDKIIVLTNLFNQAKLVDSNNYWTEILQFEPEMNKLYSQSISIGLAPNECRDLNQRFQTTMAFAHNTILPFAEKGLELWGDNRKYLVNGAIDSYQQELSKLEFELKKVCH